MKKNNANYVSPEIEELALVVESVCLADSDTSWGVEDDYDQTQGEW